MRYIMLLAALTCAGCVGEQTKAAFTMRPGVPDYGPLPPNRAAEHEANLLRAQQRATERQEADDGIQGKCHPADPVPGETCYFEVCQ